MHICSLTVENFKNAEQETIRFSEGINVIYGSNASGKTNLLEAIFFFASSVNEKRFSATFNVYGFSLRIDISSSVNFESLAIVNYPSFRLVYHLHPLSSKHSAMLFLLVCYFHCPGMRTLC